MQTKRFYAVLIPRDGEFDFDEVAVYDSEFDDVALFGWVDTYYGWKSAANVVDRLESDVTWRDNYFWDKV